MSYYILLFLTTEYNRKYKMSIYHGKKLSLLNLISNRKDKPELL